MVGQSKTNKNDRSKANWCPLNGSVTIIQGDAYSLLLHIPFGCHHSAQNLSTDSADLLPILSGYADPLEQLMSMVRFMVQIKAAVCSLSFVRRISFYDWLVLISFARREPFWPRC